MLAIGTVMQTNESTQTEVNMNECDAKGRAVGKRVVITALQQARGEAAADGTWSTIYSGPVKYAVKVYTLRDGKKFGAIPPSTCFATLEEAQALAAKKIKALEKKAFSRLSFSQVDGE